MSRLVPFLTFQAGKGQHAGEAIEFYTRLFPAGRVVSDVRHGAEGPGPEGSVMVAELELAGHPLRLSDSFVEHAWGPSPATSLWLELDTDADLRHVFAGLAEGGTVHMPLDDYGFGPFGWVDDRFGVSWQLSVVPD
ncbi:VOC family protein [Nocardioidaceae bacterium]|nr:VOC family protein [Nocardioidaceae bacterium]